MLVQPGASLLSVLFYGSNFLVSDLPTSLPAAPDSIKVPSPSANAARLLLDTPGNPGSSWNTRNQLALRQLSKQRDLQDARLNQCQEKLEDFEQCFFYGTGDPYASSTKKTKSQVPTW